MPDNRYPVSSEIFPDTEDFKMQPDTLNQRDNLGQREPNDILIHKNKRRGQFLSEIFQLSLFVSPDGVIQSIEGLSKELAHLDPSQENDSTALTLNTIMPWLAPDYQAFLSSDENISVQSKTLNLGEENDTLVIRFHKIITAAGETAGVMVFILSESMRNHLIINRETALLMSDTLRQTRVFCHDFSQPLMVLGGYWELLKSARPDTDGQKIQKQMNSVQEQIDKLNQIYQDLRNVIMHFRQQVEVLEKRITE
jgi:hypothetical protein